MALTGRGCPRLQARDRRSPRALRRLRRRSPLLASASRAGVPVLVIEDHPVAPIFSSEAELVKLVGPVRWLSTDGLRFLSLLPPGVMIGLDIASTHRLRLDPAAVRLEYALVLPGQQAEERER